MSSVVNQETARPVTPNAILVKYLGDAVQIAKNHPNLDKELIANLDQAWRLAAGLDAYVDECTSDESLALAEIAEATSKEAWSQRWSDGATVRHLEQEMLSGKVEGQLLKMLVHISRAKTVLDIGMFTGYSALAMAEALPSDGCLIACEVDHYVAEFAQNLFKTSPHGHKISVKLGSALASLSQLASVGKTFDFVFIDADKTEYVQYFQTLLDSNLLAPFGFIAVDNTLLQGQPYLPAAARSQNGEAIAQFNQIVKNDPRVEQVLLPVRDGLTIIR